MPDQTTYPPIGRINAEGLWVVTAAQADALPEGSLISLVGDERGRARAHAATEPHDERPFHGWSRTDGRWVGPTELAPEAMYRVHLPPSPSHIPGEVGHGPVAVRDVAGAEPTGARVPRLTDQARSVIEQGFGAFRCGGSVGRWRNAEGCV